MRALPGYHQLPPPLTVAQRDVVSYLPTATNSGTDFYSMAAVGTGSVTSLWATVKGKPQRGGYFLTSGSKSWNRLFQPVP